MPRLVNCIKNCCYSLLLAAFISAISSLFVWQAEVYQNTIDEQVRQMKLDISSMKKENHLMEIKLNEQFGKHEDLKEEFRYLLKQAKWSVNGGGEADNAVRDAPLNKDVEIKRALPDVRKNALEVLDMDQEEINQLEADPMNVALERMLHEQVIAGDLDLSKRVHVVVVSEKKGGGDILGGFLSKDSGIFYLPGLSGIVKTSQDFNKLTHCTVPKGLVEFYRTHPNLVATSPTLTKLCEDGGMCEALTAENLEKECMTKHVAVFEGITENWPLELVDSLGVDVVYVSRDPHAIVSQLLTDSLVTEEEVQVFSTQLCARIESFRTHLSSSHNAFQIIDYEKLAASPLATLSNLYHALFDTTTTPDLGLNKETKSGLYSSVNEWRNSLSQIAVDAVNEECGNVIVK